MNQQSLIWGVLFLVIFGGAHYLLQAGTSAFRLWGGIAILMIILTAVASKWMKGTPKGMGEVWMSATAFGVILTFASVLKVLPLPLIWLMSLWLLLFGAAKFAGGHASGVHLWNYAGLVTVFAALFVPAFGTWYFMAGALFLGLMDIVNGLVLPK